MNAVQFLEIAASVSLQVALVIASAACIRRLGRLTAQAECLLWTWAHGLILALSLVALTFPHLRLLLPDPPVASRALVTAQGQLAAGQVLLTVWLLGVAISGISLIAGWISAIRCLKSCRNIGREVLAVTGLSEDSMIDGRSVQFRTGAQVAGPCCWQLHRPYILLPESILSFSVRDRLFILRHELSHLRLGHPLQLFVQRLVEILFWFHPLVWWSARQASLSREFACDEAVVATRSDVAGYLRTLLSVVEQSQSTSDSCRETIGFGVGTNVIVLRARRLVALAQQKDEVGVKPGAGRLLRPAALCLCGALCMLAWLPVNSLASSRSRLSPWPSWSAALARDLGLPARDYEAYDPRSQLFELREDATNDSATSSR
jgi:hypothetical protein